MPPDLGAVGDVACGAMGGTVFGGMRALSGPVLTAAGARISDMLSTVPSKPLSRGAPGQESLRNESEPGPAPYGCHVTVLDLASLVTQSRGRPVTVSRRAQSGNSRWRDRSI